TTAARWPACTCAARAPIRVVASPACRDAMRPGRSCATCTGDRVRANRSLVDWPVSFCTAACKMHNVSFTVSLHPTWGREQKPATGLPGAGFFCVRAPGVPGATMRRMNGDAPGARPAPLAGRALERLRTALGDESGVLDAPANADRVGRVA